RYIMIKNNYKWLLILFLIVFVACDSDDDSTGDIVEVVELTAGEADFSNYVAVGNSLTAGYTDNALFIAAQQNSLPNILSSKFELAGGGEFSQPLMNDNIGGLVMGGTVLFQPRLYFDGSGPVVLSATPTTDVLEPLAGGPYNNMGGPGAKSFHLGFPGYGAANPYFGRFASAADATVIGDAVSQSPTFFTLWIGANDVLSYATSGGVGVSQEGNIDPSTYGTNDITDSNVFANTYSQLVGALTAGGAKGVVANIPDIKVLPHFTTVPHNPVPLDSLTAVGLNAAFAAYNGGLQNVVDNTPYLTQEEADRRMISFSAGQNSVLILDEDLTDLTGVNPVLTNMRQATAEDLLVLTSSSFIGTTVGGNPQLINGVSVPLEDKWVLTPEEQENIATATAAFNATIAQVAEANDLAFVDAHNIMNLVASSGYGSHGFILEANLVTG